MSLFYSEGLRDRGVAKRHRDHLVPCRVLVDRTTMNPADSRGLSESTVVPVNISPEEHVRLGGIFADHVGTYAAMLSSPVAAMSDFGQQRYISSGAQLHPYLL